MFATQADALHFRRRFALKGDARLSTKALSGRHVDGIYIIGLIGGAVELETITGDSVIYVAYRWKDTITLYNTSHGIQTF